MINIDIFRITLNFVPYDNWLHFRLVCHEWNEAVVSLCSSTHIVNFANGFNSDYQEIDISKIFSLLTYAFKTDHSARALALRFHVYRNWSLPFKQQPHDRSSIKNGVYIDSIAKPLLGLFTHMEELTINASLYEAIFNRPQCGVLDLGQVSNLKTLTVVNHSLQKPQVRKLPRSVRHLNFVGVAVLSRPFRKVAVRFLESITFRYFIGEKETIRDFTPDHITLYFEHHLGDTQWPTYHNRVIEYAEEMNQRYSLQIHKTPLEGYMGPNFTFYACLEGINFLNRHPHDTSADNYYRLIDYCFVEKRFPIEIEHLFFLACEYCIHDRLFHVLHIAQRNGQIERLKKQGTIHLENSSFLLKLFETDIKVALKIINEFGFDPNITENTERTMCPIKDVSPLLFQFLLADLFPSPDQLSEHCNNINDPKLSIDFTPHYKGISMARWAVALGRKDMMIH
eukprot:gb/GECH01005862.1/.p1 GENE.gb/GECH01005862.1/~~gb/GECH01005862.1/.p1  ORF type:complete len:453 (+),score=71.22 gb/GECH01005862.1/:1-1359(+)